MTMRHWEVLVPNMDLPLCIVAYTKAQAIQIAIELCPGINPLAVNIFERQEWK
jgi:hypothetical protein